MLCFLLLYAIHIYVYISFRLRPNRDVRRVQNMRYMFQGAKAFSWTICEPAWVLSRAGER